MTSGVSSLITRLAMPRHAACRTRRYWRHLRGIFDSRTAKNLSAPLISLSFTTSLVCLYQSLASSPMKPAWAQGIHPLDMSPLPFEQTRWGVLEPALKCSN